MRRQIPRADAAVDVGGNVSRPWYDFFRGLTEPRFESAEQTIAATTTIEIEHGLSGVKDARAYLVNKEAEFGFSPGDEVPAPLWQDTGGYGVQIAWDAAKLYLTTGTGVRVIKRDAPGTVGTITDNKWRLIARVP